MREVSRHLGGLRDTKGRQWESLLQRREGGEIQQLQWYSRLETDIERGGECTTAKVVSRMISVAYIRLGWGR